MGSSEFRLSHTLQELQVYNPGVTSKPFQDWFGLVKTLCRSCFLAFLTLNDPHSKAAAEAICLIRGTVNCIPGKGKQDQLLLQQHHITVCKISCSHDHSLWQSWAPCASLALLTLETHTEGLSLCAIPTGAIQLWEIKQVLLTRKMAFCLLPCPREINFWEPDPKAGWHGGHWRSVSYRFICKHEKTSSGVNKNVESRGAIFWSQKQ